MNLRKNLMGSPGRQQSWNSGMYGGQRSWVGLGFPHWLCFLCSVVRVAGVRLAPLHGIVVWVMSVGEVVSAGWCVTMPVGCVMGQVAMGAFIGWRVAWATVVAGWGAQCVPLETAAAPVMVGMAAWLSLVEMSPISGPLVIGVWSDPPGVGISMAWMRSVLVAQCSWKGGLVEAVLCKVTNWSQL